MKMTFLRHLTSLGIVIASVTALNAAKVTITLDDKGRNAEAVPVLKQGDTLELVLVGQYRLTYEFSKDPGKGRIVNCKTALTYTGKAITIPGGTENQFLYFNLFGPANPDAAKADQTKLKTWQDQYAAHRVNQKSFVPERN